MRARRFCLQVFSVLLPALFTASLAFSQEVRVLEGHEWDETIRLWEVSSGRELHHLEGHGDAVRSVSFSPDGHLLASGSDDQTIRLWEIPAAEVPAVAIASPPEPEPRNSLQGLLALADSQFSRKHYTTPKGDNAFETFREVLRLDPGNERALQTLQEMAQIYRGWGDRDFGRGNLERARQNYEKILIIFPEDREALDQLAAINSAEEEARRVAREEEERHRGDQEEVASVPPEERIWRSAGSGFFLAGSTHILTSNHVVRDVEEIRVSFPSGEQYQGSVVARDANNDLALVLLQGIQPESGGFVTDLSAEVQAGDRVHAIGYPLGARPQPGAQHCLRTGERRHGPWGQHRPVPDGRGHQRGEQRWTGHQRAWQAYRNRPCGSDPARGRGDPLRYKAFGRLPRPRPDANRAGVHRPGDAEGKPHAPPRNFPRILAFRGAD